ncbi:MAG: InlB B-repeat-containing protein [Clostridia bacterium]|nr:InlB B-repeat-containing protein [Clostridia bacterium]
MKLTKRLVAVALAILMIFGSFSVAMTASAVDGTTLGITTKILRNVNNAWIETDKVLAGEDVKLGVYLDTDYYAGDGNILLFFNNNFFETTTGTTQQTLTIGDTYKEGTSYDITGYYYIGAGLQASTAENAMLNYGKIDSDYADAHEPIYISYKFGEDAETQKFDGKKLFCEIPLKVKKDAPAAVEGYGEAKKETTASTDFTRGRINVMKGEAGGYPEEAVDMWNWDANPVYERKPVTLFTNCTAASFDADGGVLYSVTDNEGNVTNYDILYTEGEAGEKFENLVTEDGAKVVTTLPSPTKEGYTFEGWKVVGADDSTASKVTVYPEADTDYVAVWKQIEVVGNELTFRTEIYRQDENGNWVKTEKVKPGEEVKARLFIDTGYLAGDGDIILFYDGDFFEDSYESETEYDLNKEYDFKFNEEYSSDDKKMFNQSATGAPAAYGLTGKMIKPDDSNDVIEDLIADEYITSSFFGQHPALIAKYEFPVGSNCQVISGNEWFVQFDLKVKDNAVDEGDFYIVPETIAQPGEQYYAYINIPMRSEDSDLAMNADHMMLWEADIEIYSTPVSIYNTITFNANGGEFAADDTENYVISGTVGEAVDYSTIPEISRPGWTFMGWIDASDDTPTLEEAMTADELPATMTYKSDNKDETKLIYNAFWVSEVDITFKGINPEDETAYEIETIPVTAGEPFVTPATPELAGYRFVGWTTEVTWNDQGKLVIGSVLPKLPEKYPTVDTTYYAIFDSNAYPVNYYVLDADIENPTLADFELVAELNIEYNTVIPATPHGYTAPEGYVLSVAYTDVSYADTIVFADANMFVAGTTMPASEYNLYYKLERGEFEAVFDANEGAWADGETTKTVSARFEDAIVAPEAPAREGYVFAGWEPNVQVMDEEGKTFKATWNPDEFTATYYVDGEQYGKAYDILFGDEMDIPADPYKEGHEFKGWADSAESTTPVAIPATMPANDVNYYAVFEAIEYTIKFADTGDETIADITLPYGTEIVAPEDPTREGYTFKGWAETKSATADAKVELPATMPVTPKPDGKTYYGIWEINEYTVTWIVDGNETVVPYKYATPVIKVDNPSKTGYTFTGWSPEFPEEGMAMPAKDLEFTAVFTANTYNALFLTKADDETHDGRFDSDDSTVIVVPTVFNEKIVAPAEVPVRTGYTFAGWDPIVGAMDEEGKEYYAVWTPNADTKYTVEFYSMDTAGDYKLTDTQTRTGTSDSVIDLIISAPTNYKIDKVKSTYDDGVTIAADGSTVVTVYFERDLFTIAFDGNGGTVNGVASESDAKRYGAAVAVPVVEREGYTFTGWKDAEGKDVDVNLTAIENVTYIAQWEINQYTITFETVGGTEIAPIKQDYATAVTAPADPTKLGHTFAGWDKEIPSTMPAEDMTITAQWTPNIYDATFDAGDGKFADDSTIATVPGVTFGEDITAPTEKPEKEGYTFTGWLDADGNPVGTMDAEGKAFFAQWEINQYTITFDTKGGTEIAPIKQDYATAVTAPADPEREGHTFAGWDVEVPSTMPAEDITITAKWDVNPYDAIFDAGEGVFESTGVATETVPVDYDTAITAPDEEPTKTGYTFAGWEDEDGNIISAGANAGKMDADGETFTATWTPNEDTEYTVIVKDVDTDAVLKEVLKTGTTDNAIEVVESVPDPAADKTEYVLFEDVDVNGYHLFENAANDLTGKTVAPDGSTVVTLYYAVTEYTVVYDANGGAYADGTKEISKVLPYGASTSANAPIAPTREGYTFDKWLGNPTVPENGTTMRANWTPNKYTINWDTNGEVAEGTIKEEYEYTALINKKVADPREGYKFVEWVDENGVAITIPDNMPAKNLTIIAKYELESFTINFNSNGGSAVDPITQDYGTTIKAPADPTKEGYKFEGWSPDLPTTMPDLGETGDSTTVTAQWSKNSYNVNYFVKNPETGKFGEAVATATVAYEDPISTVFTYKAPTGYSLVAVAYTDTDLTAPLATGVTMPANDVNLYYDVIANEYDAIFNANDGAWADGEKSKTVKAAYNDVIKTPADPSRTGYEFAGWDPVVGTMNAEGKTFEAKWEPKTYTVTYKANGGAWGKDEAMETTKTFDVVFGTAVTAPDADPTRTGYNFKGWDNKAPATMPAEDLVFTAQWEIKTAKVIFKNGDETVKTVSGNYGDAVEAPADPVKEGHTFKGWDKTVPATIPEADVTINATWEKNSYDVIWSVDGVTTIIKDVPYDTVIDKSKAPATEKVGYDFTGWNGYTDGMKMPANDVTFTAAYTPKTFTVTFDANGGAWDNGDTEQTVTDAYGAELKAPVAPGRTGYTFQTWSPSVPTTIPAENATYKAIWTTAGKVDYTVETYYMNTVGTYDEVDPVVTGGTATIDAYVKIPVDTAPEGFTYDADEANYIEGVVKGDGSTVFKVYYERNTYTIKFVGNEGTINGTPEQSADYYYGTTVVEPVPVRTGYNFIGWADAAENGNKVAVEVTAIADATYYAQWEEATYTATFKALPGAFEDGETTDTTEFVYGNAIAEPADKPVRDGYTFDKWVDEKTGKTPAELGTEVADDVTFIATWNEIYYDIVFYTDETLDAATATTIRVLYNGEYSIPIDPEKTGYSFAGWNKVIDGEASNLSGNLGIAGSKKIKDTLGKEEYYATWDVNDVNLVYMSNGGIFADDSNRITYKVPFGTPKADMPVPEEPTREGYTFNNYNIELPATMPATPVNLLAQWTANEYDVVFDAGEGVFDNGTEDTSDDVPTRTEDVIYEQQSAFAPDEEPVRPGYEFGGWTDGENTYYPGEEIPMVADDVKLDAVWTAVDSAYTVNHIYMDVNGTYDDAEVVTENLTGTTDTTATATEKAKDNFTFDAAASTVEGTITGDGKLTLELYYVREKNTVTIYDKDGNVLDTEEVYFDAPLNVENPTKEGYTFAGWTDAEDNPVDVPATMPGDKLDIYESWTLNSYDVTFDANTGAWADGDKVKTVETNYGSAVTAPATDPIKAGHTFKGWFDAKENGNSVDTYTSMPELAEGETLTFYARWEANKNDYTIEIYEMNPDGTMPTEPTSMVINNALVGETVKANVTVPAGFTLDEANSELEGVVPEEGELVLKVVLVRAPHKFTAIVDGKAIVDSVEYYFDQTVVQVATPTKDGYTFAGWSTTAPGGIIEEGAVADTVYPARMPNNDVTIYGVWSTNSYNAIFDAGNGMFQNGTEDPADDKPVVSTPVAFGDKIYAPTEVPVQEGFEFGGWKDKDGNVHEPGAEVGTMGKDGASFEAVWNKSSFTATFYGYEALAETPYKSENATMMIGGEPKTYAYGETIEFPAAPTNIDDRYYTFIGWSKTEGGKALTNSELFTQTMPAEDVIYYAVYERVKVQLIPNDDADYWTNNGLACSTVIDRAGGTVDDYDEATSTWYVYGLTDRMTIDARRDEKRPDTYVDVSGDGYYKVVDYKVREGSVGTGTVIEVYDRNETQDTSDDILVESFWIIVYGDLNGDGAISNTDYSIAQAEVAQDTSWSYTFSPEYCHYKAKAANISGDNNFSITDAAQINYFVLGTVDINQATGCVTSK